MRNQGEKKYLKGILKCLVFGVFFLHCSAVWPLTIERGYPRKMAPFIPEIENIVNEILAEASKRLNDPDGIIRRIQALDVTLRTGHCAPTTHMWTDVNSIPHVVYVCPRTIKSLLKYQNQGVFIYVAQHLIHESIHRIGYHDECVTTEIELILMNYSSYADHVFHNGYVDECDLSDCCIPN